MQGCMQGKFKVQKCFFLEKFTSLTDQNFLRKMASFSTVKVKNKAILGLQNKKYNSIFALRR